jgi:hypothetical protein
VAFGDNFPPGFDSNNFNVEVRGGGSISAKFLTDHSGKYIMNPLSGMAYVVPKDFSSDKAIEFGRGLDSIIPLFCGALLRNVMD